MCRTPSQPPDTARFTIVSRSRVAVSERAHQHRQVDPGDAFDPPRAQQLAGEVAGRRAEDVGKDHHPAAGVELLHELARGGQQRMRIVGRGDRQHLELRGAAAEHVRDGARKAFTEAVVRNDQDADHRGSCRGAIASGGSAGSPADVGMAEIYGSTGVRRRPFRAPRRTSRRRRSPTAARSRRSTSGLSR